MTGYQGNDWLEVELLSDGKALWCQCHRCGCNTTTVSDRPDMLEGVLYRFVKVHERCKERVTV